MKIVIQDNQARETSLETNRLMFKEYSKGFKKIILFLIAFGVVCYAYFYYLIEIAPSKGTISRSIYWQIFFLFSFFICLVLIRWSAVKGRFWTKAVSITNLLYKQTNIKLITINEEGIEEETVGYKYLTKWQMVTSFQIGKSFIRIFDFSAQSIFIPIKLLTSDDYEALLFYLRGTKREIK